MKRINLTFVFIAAYFTISLVVSRIFEVPAFALLLGLDIIYLIALLARRTLISKFQMVVLYVVFLPFLPWKGVQHEGLQVAALWLFIVISAYDMLVNRKDDTGPVSSQ